jgi:hypothetical protein
VNQRTNQGTEDAIVREVVRWAAGLSSPNDVGHCCYMVVPPCQFPRFCGLDFLLNVAALVDTGIVPHPAILVLKSQDHGRVEEFSETPTTLNETARPCRIKFQSMLFRGQDIISMKPVLVKAPPVAAAPSGHRPEHWLWLA